MPGRPPKVDQFRRGFISRCKSERGLVEAVSALSGINPNALDRQLHPEHARRAIELAFLGLVASWEDFLEHTFVRYLAGAVADSGYSPSLRMGTASGMAHAYQVLSGDPKYDPNKHYSKFGDPKWVIATARLYFEQGAPYATRMHPRVQPLQLAVKLRNRVAHASAKAKSDFKSAAQTHLGLNTGDSLRKGYSVGDLLVEPASNLFGQRAKDKSWTYFEAYDDMYRQLAKGIVPES